MEYCVHKRAHVRPCLYVRAWGQAGGQAWVRPFIIWANVSSISIVIINSIIIIWARVHVSASI